MERRHVLPVVVPAATALCLVAIGWITFGVDWVTLDPGWLPLPARAVPLWIANTVALAAAGMFANRRDAGRAIGALSVVVGLAALGVALGTVSCTGVLYPDGAVHDVTYDGDVVRFGDHTPPQANYRCRADPAEWGLVVAYGLVTVGTYVVLDPDVSHRIR